MEQTKYDVFISYSRKDTDTANRICAALERQGISYFIDRQGIGGGLEFPEVLADAIVSCRIMLYIASSNSYRSKFTNNEIAFAFNEKSKGSILPYIIDGSRLPTSQRFIFASVNIRTLKEHPIDTILMQDLCQLLGRKYKEQAKDTKQNTIKKDSERKSEKYAKSTFSNNVDQFIEKVIDYYDKRWYIVVGICITASILAYLINNYYCWLILCCCGIILFIIGIISLYLSSSSINDKGLKYYNQGDYGSALRYFLNAAERGNACAQYHLGLMCRYGHGVQQSDKDAVMWYKKAAEQGYTDAQYNLAVMYSNGFGVQRSDKDAVMWYKKAAEQGDANAQNNLGVMYRNGLGVQQNDTEAVKWYQKAAEQGETTAQNNLGFCYHYGLGVPQDNNEAVKWFSKAAEQGYAAAQYQLGVCYENGLGVSQDNTEALKWYRKAEEQGNSDAKNRVIILENRDTPSAGLSIK